MIPVTLVSIPERKLVGMHLPMSLANNQTGSLWQQFMPRRKEISHRVNGELYDIKVYAPDFQLKDFTPSTMFEKWVAVEVAAWENIPDGMEPLILPGGAYAVAEHRGPARDFYKTWNYIFSEWLPVSGFVMDDRHHFEILQENYRSDDPHAREDVWIPIRPA